MSRSMSESPLDFEITRVDCTLRGIGSWLVCFYFVCGLCTVCLDYFVLFLLVSLIGCFFVVVFFIVAFSEHLLCFFFFFFFFFFFL